ncbi:MAG: hypothetical protein M1816_003607 [Peltula sp. TS41687]|nr:MAG: hypothetical protein M1816_003607 [Peltula sp. TS41687]
MLLRTKTASISKDMISPPSPTIPDISDLHADTIPPPLAVALEYISRKLHAKSIHMTLVVVKACTTVTAGGQDVQMILTGPISTRCQKVLRDVASSAEKKYPHIRNGWLRALAEPGLEDAETHYTYLIQRSLLQREVLFSTESLILLNVDHIYTLKHRLRDFSDLPPAFAQAACLSSLRRVVMLYGNRPLSAGYLLRAYDHLTVEEQTLRDVDEAYRARFGGPGIVIGGALAPTPGLPPAGFGVPKTPNSATDLSPGTKNEWSFYMTGLP